jgi:hypothetical protein
MNQRPPLWPASDRRCAIWTSLHVFSLHTLTERDRVAQLSPARCVPLLRSLWRCLPAGKVADDAGPGLDVIALDDVDEVVVGLVHPQLAVPLAVTGIDRGRG